MTTSWTAARLTACLLLAFGCWPEAPRAAAAVSDVVAYEVSPVMERGRLAALAIVVRTEGDASGRTRLLLPDRWNGQRDLWRAVRDVEVEGGRATASSPSEREVVHAPGARLTIRYRVTATSAAPAHIDEASPARLHLAADRFQAPGHALFLRVQGRGQARAALTGWPGEWRPVSDLPSGRTLPWRDLRASVIAGGPGARVVDREAGGGRLRLVLLGDFAAPDGALAGAAAKLLQAQNQLLGAAEPHLVTLAPLAGGAPNEFSVVGFGLGDSSMMFATPNAREDRFARIFAHELVHAWLPEWVGGAAGEGALDLWFSEGFADFYAQRLLARAGLTDHQGFAAALSKKWADYELSEVRGVSNEVLAAGYFRSRDLEELAYLRGFALATRWDHDVRRATRGRSDLDDVLAAMRRAAPANAAASPRRLLIRAMMEVAGLDIGADVARHVERGVPVELPADLFPGCLMVERHAGMLTVQTPRRGGASAETCLRRFGGP